MGALARHLQPQAAAVYPGLAAADESVVLAGGHSDVREKYRGAGHGFRSAADRDFLWAVSVPPVEQGGDLPERQGPRRPAARQRVVCWERQPLLVEVAWLRAAQEQPAGEWVSAGPQVPQASRLQGYLLAQEPAPWEPLSARREPPPEQGSQEWPAPLVLPRARQAH